MKIKGAFINAKDASRFYQIGTVRARVKLQKLAKSLGKYRQHKRWGQIPNIKGITYKEFAEAHNMTVEDLEKFIN